MIISAKTTTQNIDKKTINATNKDVPPISKKDKIINGITIKPKKIEE